MWFEFLDDLGGAAWPVDVQGLLVEAFLRQRSQVGLENALERSLQLVDIPGANSARPGYMAHELEMVYRKEDLV